MWQAKKVKDLVRQNPAKPGKKCTLAQPFGDRTSGRRSCCGASLDINDCTLHDEPTAPFGGVKNSGFGRENGRCGIEEMTEVKWITIQAGKRAFPI